jgi:head-tail adaptor
MAYRRNPIDPGEKDRRITIEQRPATTTVDSSGAPLDGPWTTLVSGVAACRGDVTGWERVQMQQTSARYDVRYEIGYRADMDPDLLDVPKLRRVKEFDRVHDIVSASVIGARDGIELMTIMKPMVES